MILLLEQKQKIEDWHKLVDIGLNNGLSFTNDDSRTEKIDFWRKRSELFTEFCIAVMNLVWGNNYSDNEKNLEEMSKEGYQK